MEQGVQATSASWRESICISVDCEDSGSPVNVEDQLFDMFKDEQDDKVHMGRFIAALTETGLRRTDPRLKEMRDNLAEVHAQLEDVEATSVTALNLDRSSFVRSQNSPIHSRSGSPRFFEWSPSRSFDGSPESRRRRVTLTSPTARSLDRRDFKKVIRDNIVLISKALRHQLVIPEWHDFCAHIEEFYWNAKNLPGGKVASYIPQLARFSPDYWGVSVCTTDGQRYGVGDTNVNFTMQSC
ncbi:unnamed protein product, partial [Meganyctiphanes norvegica]